MTMPDYWTIYTLGWTLIVCLGIALLHIHRQDRVVQSLTRANYELLRANSELCDAVEEHVAARKGRQ